MLLNLIHECPKKPYTNLICSVIIISVSREISLYLIIFCKSVLITDNLNLCIFDS